MEEISTYLNGLKLGKRSDSIIRTYTKDLNKFQEFFNLQSLEQLKSLTMADLQRFYQFQSEKLSPKSLNALTLSLSAFFKWLKLDNSHPFYQGVFGGSMYVKEPKRHKVVLSESETKSLILSANNIQDRLMLAIMLTTALRRDEVANIKLSDIQENHIRIIGKGDKERVTTLTPVIHTMLNVYLAQRKSDSEYLFYSTRGTKSDNGKLNGGSVNSRVKHYVQLCVKNGLIPAEKGNKITAHRLRGTVLTQVAKEFGIYAAQKIAGHSSINTTMLYLEDGDQVTETVIQKRADKFDEMFK